MRGPGQEANTTVVKQREQQTKIKLKHLKPVQTGSNFHSLQLWDHRCSGRSHSAVAHSILVRTAPAAL